MVFSINVVKIFCFLFLVQVLGWFPALAQVKATIQFDKTIGGDWVDGLYSVVQTKDGGFLLAGGSYSEPSFDKSAVQYGVCDIWLVKIDAVGNKMWDKSFGGGSQDAVIKIIEALEGGYLIGGISDSDISGNKTSPSLSQSDYWLIKINEDGNKEWEQTYGEGGVNILQSLIVTSDGNYMLAGFTNFYPNDNPEMDWEDYHVLKVGVKRMAAIRTTFCPL